MTIDHSGQRRATGTVRNDLVLLPMMMHALSSIDWIGVVGCAATATDEWQWIRGPMIVIAREATQPFEYKSPPRFAPGDLVQHRRYGYRGVIVECDPSCKANIEWYLTNNTQPNRNQPWYHVLVDSTGTTTYAAESSLESDPSAEPIDHPLLDYFFEDFHCGHYVRNDRPWRGWA